VNFFLLNREESAASASALDARAEGKGKIFFA
jgi:hypothetical protein